MYYIIKYKFTYNYFWNFKKNLKIIKISYHQKNLYSTSGGNFKQIRQLYWVCNINLLIKLSNYKSKFVF